MLPSEDDSGVMSEQTCEILPEKKRKKKKIKAKEDEMKSSSDVPAEKKSEKHHQ